MTALAMKTKFFLGGGEFLLLGILAALPMIVLCEARGAEPPSVKVLSVRPVYCQDTHNAFKDLCRFQGQLYLTFRSCPEGHGVHPTSSILVLSSKDGKDWGEVHRFHVPKRDTRDPHFLVFQEKLFVYTGTWYCGDRSPKAEEYDLNRHLGYAAWTADGRRWQGPVMLEGTYGHYIWRAAAFGGKAYLCGRRIREFAQSDPPRGYPRSTVESAMLESDDGLVWKKAGLFQEHNGDETAFLFEPDGSVLAVARAGSGSAQLCRSRPPYAQWQRKELGRYIGGPLLAKWQGSYLVGGRKMVGGQPRTVLSWLIHDELKDFAQLPSAGDNSYPGFVELSPTRALVSYYSSHEQDAEGKTITAIYLAELEMVGSPGASGASSEPAR